MKVKVVCRNIRTKPGPVAKNATEAIANIFGMSSVYILMRW